MSVKKLEDLQKVTGVLYLEEQAKISKLLAKEESIRSALGRLDEQRKSGLDSGMGDDAMKMIGADLLWNAWQHSTRQRLNMELAQIRGQKLQLMGRVRLAFGRDQAIRKLVDEKKNDRVMQKRKRNEARNLGWT